MVDSGNLANKPETLGITARIMARFGYDAIGVGAMDLRMGDEFFDQLASNNLVVLDVGPDARESTKPYIIKEVAGVKVGIVSFRGIRSNSSGDIDYQTRRAMYSAFKEARDASDILILLDQARLADADWLRRNGPRLGEPDIIIGGVGNKRLTEPNRIGNAYVVPTSTQVRTLGVADIEFTRGQELKLAAISMPLDKEVAEDEKIKELVEEHRAELQKISAVDRRSSATTAFIRKSPTGGTPYYSSRLCKVCHRDQYQDWEKSDHAHAMTTLIDAKRVIPDCLTCHSELYSRLEDTSAPTQNDTSGVECATCHIDALPHGMERRGVTEKTKVDPQLCLTCHDGEWSPDYDQESYFARISHHGTSTTSAILKPEGH